MVDEVFDHSRYIAERLHAASNDGSGILHDIAQRLLSFGGELPLEAAQMRGGMYRQSLWARSPAQPLVCVSTVDQLGSRLLFRGYGLGRGVCNTLPIHAGLIGNDALIILDEAHLSQAFAETLDAVSRYRTWLDGLPIMPWHVVRMSATPIGAENAFKLSPEDYSNPLLGRRLAARKAAMLIKIRCKAAPSG